MCKISKYRNIQILARGKLRLVFSKMNYQTRWSDRTFSERWRQELDGTWENPELLLRDGGDANWSDRHQELRERRRVFAVRHREAEASWLVTWHTAMTSSPGEETCRRSRLTEASATPPCGITQNCEVIFFFYSVGYLNNDLRFSRVSILAS